MEKVQRSQTLHLSLMSQPVLANTHVLLKEAVCHLPFSCRILTCIIIIPGRNINTCTTTTTALVDEKTVIWISGAFQLRYSVLYYWDPESNFSKRCTFPNWTEKDLLSLMGRFFFFLFVLFLFGNFFFYLYLILLKYHQMFIADTFPIK